MLRGRLGLEKQRESPMPTGTACFGCPVAPSWCAMEPSALSERLRRVTAAQWTKENTEYPFNHFP